MTVGRRLSSLKRWAQSGIRGGWYKRLFWKIFLIIWLVSAAGTGAVLVGLLTVTDKRQSLELLETKARAQAALMLERYQQPERDEHHEHRFHRRLPLWIITEDKQVLIGPEGRIPKGARGIRYPLEETWQGQALTAVVPAPPEGFYIKRLLGFLFSLQAVLVLLVSALAALLLSWMIVRPINQLCRHAKELYYHQNLASRASGRLSERSDEIGELSREFNQMAAYVERTLTAQQRLLQDVSHELRAPLARLQVAAGLAEQRLGEGDRAVARINHECERLDELIGEILSLSRLDQASPRGEPFRVVALCNELAEDLAYFQPERELVLDIVPADLELTLNQSLLQRALGNLLSNAAKYTPAGGRILLSARAEAPDQVRILLRDQGPGVDESILDRLTEPFFRGQSESIEGFGLGLSITRRAIERLSGTLMLRNHPDGGLECEILLPLKVARLKG